jgi:hypothetical protein
MTDQERELWDEIAVLTAHLRLKREARLASTPAVGAPPLAKVLPFRPRPT